MPTDLPTRGAAHLALRRWWHVALASTITLLAVLLGFGAPAAAHADQGRDDPAPPLIVVGLGSLRWSEVDAHTTSNLWELLHSSDAHAGSIVVRATSSTTCPVDGWLTVSAGRRAGGAERGQPCAHMPITANPVRASAWPDYLHAAASSPYGAQPGTLGQVLAAGNIPAAALGPGAVVAITQPDGTLADPQLADGAPLVETTTRTATAGALKAGARLVVVDAASGIDDELRVRRTSSEAATAREVASAVDAQLGAVLQAARDADEPVRVIAMGLFDRYRVPSLHVYAAATITGSQSAPGQTLAALTSAATRQPALTQTTDLLPTIATHFHLSLPTTAVGSPIVAADTQLRAADLAADQADYNLHLDRSRAAVPWFYPLYLIAIFALLIASAVTFATPMRSRISARSHLALAFAALTCASMPLGVYLVDQLPWWRTDASTSLVLVGVSLAAALLAGIALGIGGARHVALPAGLLGAALWMVLVVDALLGAPLQRTALMGSFATVGGRFYGVNNTSFVLLAASGLLTAALFAERSRSPRRGAIWFVVIGLITVVVDGAPAIGADFGGPPALVPAFVIAALLAAGVRLGWWRVVSVLGATGVIVTAIALVDYWQPEAERTHLGRLVQSVVDGEAGQLILRKAGANLSILFSSYFTLSALASTAFLIVLYLASRPGAKKRHVAWRYRWVMDRNAGLPARIATLRPTAIGMATAFTLGFMLNDSGSSIPATGLAFALPALLATIHLLAAKHTAGLPARGTKRHR